VAAADVVAGVGIARGGVGVVVGVAGGVRVSIGGGRGGGRRRVIVGGVVAGGPTFG
jgi:hypothetical protein